MALLLRWISVRPRGRDPAAVGHDRLKAGRCCHPGGGAGRPTVQAQFAVGWHEDDITRSENRGYPVQRDGEFPFKKEQHLLPSGPVGDSTQASGHIQLPGAKLRAAP